MHPSAEARSESLIEALPYIQRFRGQTFVIKYGGAAMEEEAVVERFLRDVVFLEAVGINPVVVHGGGKAITARMRAEGIHARFVNGLRVTDETSIRIVESTLDGEINPQIVETIRRFGGRAVGLSGKSVFVASVLPPQPNDAGELVDIGSVGEAASITDAAVREAVNAEIVPVISPIGATPEGRVLNINADIAAASLAASLKATKLIYASDVPGIMRDPADRDTLISGVNVSQIDVLIRNKVVAGGMIPKLRSAASALEAGVGKVHMIGGHIPHGLLLEIFSDSGIGTEITLDSAGGPAGRRK
ncbi:MAG: acetylglutamate kinase [Terrimicrobiaceae bacterium]